MKFLWRPPAPNLKRNRVRAQCLPRQSELQDRASSDFNVPEIEENCSKALVQNQIRRTVRNARERIESKVCRSRFRSPDPEENVEGKPSHQDMSNCGLGPRASQFDAQVRLETINKLRQPMPRLAEYVPAKTCFLKVRSLSLRTFPNVAFNENGQHTTRHADTAPQHQPRSS